MANGRHKDSSVAQSSVPTDGIEGLFDDCELRFGRDKRLAEVSHVLLCLADTKKPASSLLTRIGHSRNAAICSFVHKEACMLCLLVLTSFNETGSKHRMQD